MASKETGFTLIELLVAVVLLGLVLLLAQSALHFGMQMWGNKEDPSSYSDLKVQSFLRNILSEACPILIKLPSKPETRVSFFGERNSVRFVARMPKHLGVAGLYQVYLYPRDGELEMAWHLFRPTDIGEARYTQRVTLLSEVKQVEFAYYGSHGLAEPSWYDSWEDYSFLPTLIRINVKFKSGTKTWPDLVVHPSTVSMKPILPEDF